MENGCLLSICLLDAFGITKSSISLFLVFIWLRKGYKNLFRLKHHFSSWTISVLAGTLKGNRRFLELRSLGCIDTRLNKTGVNSLSLYIKTTSGSSLDESWFIIFLN